MATWDISDPAKPRSLGPPQVGHNEPVLETVFSPAGRFLATASTNKLNMWQLADGQVPRRPTQIEQTGSVQALAFSPHGNILATGNHSGAVVLWGITNPRFPRPLGRPLTTHSDPVYLMAFDAAGNIMTTSSSDGLTVTWEFTELNDMLRHTVDRACERAGRDLNKQEWDEYVGDEYEYRRSCGE